MNKNIDLGLLILRLTLGILMLFHGIAKIVHGVAGIENMLTGKSLPTFLAYGVYIGEIIVPIMIIIGIRTRLAGLTFAINMLFALLLAHAGDVLSLSEHGGWKVELLALYFFGGLVLYFTGSGQYALSTNNRWD